MYLCPILYFTGNFSVWSVYIVSFIYQILQYISFFFLWVAGVIFVSKFSSCNWSACAFFGFVYRNPCICFFIYPLWVSSKSGKNHWQHWLLYLSNETAVYYEYISELWTWWKTPVPHVNISHFSPWKPAHIHCVIHIERRDDQSTGYMCYHCSHFIWWKLTITHFYLTNLLGMLIFHLYRKIFRGMDGHSSVIWIKKL